MEQKSEQVKNCTNCRFAYLVNGKVECHRREAGGVVVEIGEEHIWMNCAARDVEVWDEKHIDRKLERLKFREYKKDIKLRCKVGINDIVGGD